jgi:hypothetical protein
MQIILGCSGELARTCLLAGLEKHFGNPMMGFVLWKLSVDTSGARGGSGIELVTWRTNHREDVH